MNEGQLTLKMKKHLISRGAYAEVIWGGGFQASGIPDILASYKGRFLGLEVKLDYNKPSKIQEVKLEWINRSGGIGRVVRSVDEVEEVLATIDKEEESKMRRLKLALNSKYGIINEEEER